LDSNKYSETIWQLGLAPERARKGCYQKINQELYFQFHEKLTSFGNLGGLAPMPYRLALESKPLDLEMFDSKVHNPNLKVWIPINISRRYGS